jgi:hypothetical protein
LFGTVINGNRAVCAFPLGSAVRSAIPAVLRRLAPACGQAVTDREFNLAAPDADILQRTIIEALELANSAAPASFRGHATRESPAA